MPSNQNRRVIIGRYSIQSLKPRFGWLLSTLTVLSLVIVLFIRPPVLVAATLKDLVNQKTQLQKEIEAKKQEAEAKKKQAEAEKKRQADLNAVIKRLENDINATTSRLNQTETNIQTTLAAIVVQQGHIGAKEKEIATKKQEINESAAELHIAQDQDNQLYAIFASDSITTALDRVAALDSLSDKLIADSEELDRQRQQLLAEKATLEQKQQELENQKKQLAAYQRALDNQKGQKTVLVQQSKEAQKVLVNQANEAIKVSEDLRKQFAAVAKEEAAMRRSSSRSVGASAVRGNAPPSSYGLIWPADGYITTFFGGRTPFQNFHTGYDIAGSAGDPIRAASAGSVSVATNMCCSDYSNTVDHSYGYGNYIMVKHDNGLVTLYGHLMEMIVVPGERVDRGQVIGYRGGGIGMVGAGWSTGPHLHFEVRDAQGPDDPGKYLP